MCLYLFSHKDHLYKSFWIIVLLNNIKYIEFPLIQSLKLEENGMKYNSNIKEKLDPYLEFHQKQEQGGTFQENNVIHFYE